MDEAERACVGDAVGDVEDLPRALCPRVPFVSAQWAARGRGRTCRAAGYACRVATGTLL